MFQLFTKKNYSASYFEYRTTVQTEEELEQWVEQAVNAYEGIAWLCIEEGVAVNLRTFEYDKKGHTVDRRSAVEYVKDGDEIVKNTLYCIDDARKNLTKPNIEK